MNSTNKWWFEFWQDQTLDLESDMEDHLLGEEPQLTQDLIERCNRSHIVEQFTKDPKYTESSEGENYGYYD